MYGPLFLVCFIVWLMTLCAYLVLTTVSYVYDIIVTIIRSNSPGVNSCHKIITIVILLILPTASFILSILSMIYHENPGSNINSPSAPSCQNSTQPQTSTLPEGWECEYDHDCEIYQFCSMERGIDYGMNTEVVGKCLMKKCDSDLDCPYFSKYICLESTCSNYKCSISLKESCQCEENEECGNLEKCMKYGTKEGYVESKCVPFMDECYRDEQCGKDNYCGTINNYNGESRVL